MEDVFALLARFPEGWSEASYDGARWGVTRTVHAQRRSQSLYAEQLAGTGVVSTNAYLVGGEAVLKPCEMPADVVLAFLRGAAPAPM